MPRRARGEQLECQLSVLELRPTLDEVEAAHRKLRAEVLGLTEELRVRSRVWLGPEDPA